MVEVRNELWQCVNRFLITITCGIELANLSQVSTRQRARALAHYNLTLF